MNQMPPDNTPNSKPIILNPHPTEAIGKMIPGPCPEPGLIIQTDAAGNIKPALEEQFTLQPFPDGSLFRFGPSGKPDGSVFLIDSNNQLVGLIRNPFLADFICRGAHLFLTALREHSPAPPENNLPANENQTT